MPAPTWVELHYSTGFYPQWDTLVRRVSDAVPFCLGDILLPLLIIAPFALWAVRFRRLRRGRLQHFFGVRKSIVVASIADITLETGALLALVFLWFMFSWGYNYARIPVNRKMVLHPERVSTAAVTALADKTVRMLNANVDAAHAAHYDDARMQRSLEPTFEALIERLGDRTAFAPAPIKPTLFEPFMRASATYGFTDPWTHEINLSSSLSPLERPAAYAHEWSHLSGFADESEANFIGAITCIASKDPALRYSGWMLVWFNLPANIHVRQRARPAVIADVKEILARYRRQTKPAVERAQRAVYDRYLHANNVEAGFSSYRLFVQLITAGTFDKQGLPIVQ